MEGHLDHIIFSTIGEKTADSIFKCDALVLPHSAQCFAMDQSHFSSTKFASSIEQTPGSFLSKSLNGRTPQSASKHATIVISLSTFCILFDMARKIFFSFCLSVTSHVSRDTAATIRQAGLHSLTADRANPHSTHNIHVHVCYAYIYIYTRIYTYNMHICMYMCTYTLWLLH